jgi:hypothetical protein
MAMKLNCIAAPDVAHGGNVQGTSSGSCRTPVHHGARELDKDPISKHCSHHVDICGLCCC